MSRRFYSEIHLHMVWHTKESQAILTPDVEPVVYRHIQEKLSRTPGIFLHALGGTETHIHLAVRIEPTITISELVGQIKGYSSHETNKEWAGNRARLEWQSGYGVVSFGTRNLTWVTDYVKNQKQHHARGTTQARLERVADE